MPVQENELYLSTTRYALILDFLLLPGFCEQFLLINHIFSKTLLLLPEQEIECTYDKDTDEMVWYPNAVENCNSKYIFNKHVDLGLKQHS